MPQLVLHRLCPHIRKPEQRGSQQGSGGSTWMSLNSTRRAVMTACASTAPPPAPGAGSARAPEAPVPGRPVLRRCTSFSSTATWRDRSADCCCSTLRRGTTVSTLGLQLQAVMSFRQVSTHRLQKLHGLTVCMRRCSVAGTTMPADGHQAEASPLTLQWWVVLEGFLLIAVPRLIRVRTPALPAITRGIGGGLPQPHLQRPLLSRRRLQRVRHVHVRLLHPLVLHL
jgi:hypothetical protein